MAPVLQWKGQMRLSRTVEWTGHGALLSKVRRGGSTIHLSTSLLRTDALDLEVVSVFDFAMRLKGDICYHRCVERLRICYSLFGWITTSVYIGMRSKCWNLEFVRGCNHAPSGWNKCPLWSLHKQFADIQSLHSLSDGRSWLIECHLVLLL